MCSSFLCLIHIRICLFFGTYGGEYFKLLLWSTTNAWKALPGIRNLLWKFCHHSTWMSFSDCWVVRSIILKIFNISYWVLASPIPYITYMALPNSFFLNYSRKKEKWQEEKRSGREKSKKQLKRQHTNERLKLLQCCYASIVYIFSSFYFQQICIFRHKICLS